MINLKVSSNSYNHQAYAKNNRNFSNLDNFRKVGFSANADADIFETTVEPPKSSWLKDNWQGLLVGVVAATGAALLFLRGKEANAEQLVKENVVRKEPVSKAKLEASRVMQVVEENPLDPDNYVHVQGTNMVILGITENKGMLVFHTSTELPQNKLN